MPSKLEAGSPAARARRVQTDALFRAAADQAPLVMWIVNAKGAVTYLNHCWYELVGGVPPQWYGHEWGELVHPDDLALMRDRWKASSKTGAVFEGTRRVKARDGSWHTLSYRAMPVFDANGLACWVGMDTDITEMVRTQAALAFANRELEAFSYAVSHDLRSPMVTVQGFCKLAEKLVEDDPRPQLRHYVDRIEQAVAHMDRLVEGLLLLSQCKRDALELQEEVDLSAIASHVLERLRLSAPERKAALRVEPGLHARGDARLLAALLENLLGNAWKFTSKVESAAISVGEVSRTPAEVVFFVKDNGAGFEMARSASLFTAFERLHTQAEFPGMGIGLATVDRVAQRHGGRAWAQSQPGAGSTFYFSLPCGSTPTSPA